MVWGNTLLYWRNQENFERMRYRSVRHRVKRWQRFGPLGGELLVGAVVRVTLSRKVSNCWAIVECFSLPPLKSIMLIPVLARMERSAENRIE